MLGMIFPTFNWRNLQFKYYYLGQRKDSGSPLSLTSSNIGLRYKSLGNDERYIIRCIVGIPGCKKQHLCGYCTPVIGILK